MIIVDSVERAFRVERFMPTLDGKWYCAWCRKVFPDVALRQTLDAHLRTCTQPVTSDDGPWDIPGYPTFGDRRGH